LLTLLRILNPILPMFLPSNYPVKKCHFWCSEVFSFRRYNESEVSLSHLFDMLILALTFPLGKKVTLLFPLINGGFEEN